MTRALAWLLAVLLLGAIATSCAQSFRLEREQRAHAETRAAFDRYRGEADALRADASEAARTREKELRDAADQSNARARELDALLARERGDAGRASQRLRDAAATAALTARSACSAATSAAVGQARSDAAGVLADVFGLADQAAGRMAEIAQQRGNSLGQCEMMYDAAVSPVR